MNGLALTNFNFSVVDANNYGAYKRYALSVPNLSEEDERNLLENLKESNCLKSAHKLIISQLKTVIRIAQQYKNYGLLEEDLVQEGNIGLMKAVKNFDTKQRVRLYTYALLWIKSEIQSFILKNWKIVKIGTTKNLKKLFFNFRSVQKEMIDLNIDKKNLTEIVSKKLNVSEDEVREIQSYFSNDEVNIDFDDEDHPVFELVDANTPETLLIESKDVAKQTSLINESLSVLNEKQLAVIKLRYYEEEKKTHKEISKILGVSSERVRQLEVEALEKIKKNIK